MHEGTLLVARRKWWKDPLPYRPAPTVQESTEPKTIIAEDRNCETVTENACMSGAVRTISPEESAGKDYFSNGVGGRPCALEERYRYFNGLGFDVTIFDSRGLYWRIPHDPTNITGTFDLACRITAAPGVTVNSKGTPERVEGILKERLLDRAINNGWQSLGGLRNLRVCEWESVIYSGEFGHEDTLYISDLNLFISKVTNYLDAPYHPDAIAKIEGRSYGKGLTFGAFVNWNEGDRPQNYYVRMCERTRTLPVIRNHTLPTGVYRFIRDGDKPVVPVMVKDSDLGLTKFWHEIPIFKTSREADDATSQNIVGQLEMDAVEKERASLQALSEEFEEGQRKLRQENAALEDKIRMQNLETANDKKALDLEIMKIKEQGAVRNDSREDTSSWLKYVAGMCTIGIGLWKAFS